MKTIILAAGKASRLGKLARNMQKCMISFGGKPAILHLIDKLPVSDEIIVCLSNDYRGELLKSYLVESRPNMTFRFVTQPSPIGTANAVSICLPDNSEDLLISWSDIIPKLDIHIPNEASIFTTNDFSCRYRFDGSKIEATDGNVIGMFYIPKRDNVPLKLSLRDTISDEFVDAIKESNIKFCNVPIQCYDFGTNKTLEATSESLNTSAYADITQSDLVVTKRYNHLSGDLFEKEITWYGFSPLSVRRFTPQIYRIDFDNKEFDMEFISACQVDFNTEDAMKDFLSHTIYVLDEYFHTNKYPPDRDSLSNEYLNMVLDRCDFAYRAIPGFKEDTININGVDYKNPVKLLQSRGNAIVDRLMPDSFCFIHGDPTLQNMLCDGNRVWFIDPKAKFGNIWLYGDPKYDFAKLYYSFVGNYDKFNTGGYELKTSSDHCFEYSIDRAKFANLGDWYLSYLHKTLSIVPEDVKLIHALIWLRVVGYVLPKSIEQAMVAYLNGTVLLNEVVDER